MSMKWHLHLEGFSCRLQNTIMMQKYNLKKKEFTVV